MQFCYVDESGTGNEPFAIMVGVIVNANRMHVTKNHWSDLLNTLSDICKRKIHEFHTRDFYKGNKQWRRLDGKTRSRIISAILDWLKRRKHKIIFSGIDKSMFKREKRTNSKLKDLKSIWCFMGLHLMLSAQKCFQNYKSNKGNIIFIFDNQVCEKTRFGFLVNKPPVWTNTYYGKKTNTLPFNQIVDVPYYGNSEEVHLIQVADLIAYLLRIYVEFKEKAKFKDYLDEEVKIDAWVKKIVSFSLPVASRYPVREKNEATEIFFKYTPESLSKLGR